MVEKDFDPETMTMATRYDVRQMYERLWGTFPIFEILARENPSIEYLDLTQETEAEGLCKWNMN